MKIITKLNGMILKMKSKNKFLDAVKTLMLKFLEAVIPWTLIASQQRSDRLAVHADLVVTNNIMAVLSAVNYPMIDWQVTGTFTK